MGRDIRITFAESAIDDLEAVLAYYVAKEIPEVGRRLVTRVVQQIEPLAQQPDMGRVVPEFSIPHLRELIRPPFRIIYQRQPDRVRIVRVWRSERHLALPPEV